MQLDVVSGNEKNDEEMKIYTQKNIDKNGRIIQNKTPHGALNYPISSLHLIQDSNNIGAKKFNFVHKNNKLRIV